MLTKKQYDLLLFIDKYLKKNGVSPSFDEMRSALRLKSKSGIHRLIQGLEERRFIRHIPNKARALEIIRMPENLKAEFLQKDSAACILDNMRPSLPYDIHRKGNKRSDKMARNRPIVFPAFGTCKNNHRSLFSKSHRSIRPV